MANVYDIIWGTLVGGSAPIWMVIPKWRRKVLKALSERMGHFDTPRAGPRGVSRELNRPAVLIHAVSLGEINATRAMVAQLSARRSDLQFIVTTTTDTGYKRGGELYGNDPRVTLVHYPLDFTSAIARLLDGLRPSVAVLMELEVWPKLVYQCERRKIPVLLVNGRLTAPSFSHYRKGLPIVRRMFHRLSAVCAQEKTYADRFIALGAPPDRVQVTGTMKFDTAEVAQRIAGDAELAEAVGLKGTFLFSTGKGTFLFSQQRADDPAGAPGPPPDAAPLLVCGSTGPGEEAAILRVYRELLKDQPQLRLVIVPRHPQRFDEVAEIIQNADFPLIRRSAATSSIQNPNTKIQNFPPVILGDTMGELRKFYSLATVVFVGRSLVDLGPRQHGSDMIEPAALAKPMVVGPWTYNFTEPMNQFRQANAIRVAADESELKKVLEELLSDPGAAAEMGRRAQEVVRREQGATGRHVELIWQFLPNSSDSKDSVGL